jgi:hypothetical protein
LMMQGIKPEGHANRAQEWLKSDDRHEGRAVLEIQRRHEAFWASIIGSDIFISRLAEDFITEDIEFEPSDRFLDVIDQVMLLVENRLPEIFAEINAEVLEKYRHTVPVFALDAFEGLALYALNEVLAPLKSSLMQVENVNENLAELLVEKLQVYFLLAKIRQASGIRQDGQEVSASLQGKFLAFTRLVFDLNKISFPELAAAFCDKTHTPAQILLERVFDYTIPQEMLEIKEVQDALHILAGVAISDYETRHQPS